MKKIKVAIMQEDTESLMQVRQKEIEGEAGICFTFERVGNEVKVSAGVAGEIDTYVILGLSKAIRDMFKNIAKDKEGADVMERTFVMELLSGAVNEREKK